MADQPRAAIVTGASRGIGLAIAQALVDRGDRVCITGRNAEPLAEAVGRAGRRAGHRTSPARRTTPPTRTRRSPGPCEAFGRIDYLVNNVGTNPVFGPVLDLDPDVVRKILDINVVSRVRVDPAVYRAWMGRHGGAVVNVASVAGLRPAPGLGIYGMSKAALIYLTEQLAVELGAEGPGQRGRPGGGEDAVRPGPLRGPRGGRSPPRYPAGRLGVPEDVGRRGGVPALRRGELDHRPDPGPRRRRHPRRRRRLITPRRDGRTPVRADLRAVEVRVARGGVTWRSCRAASRRARSWS